MTDTPNLSIRSSSIWSPAGKAAAKQTKRSMFDNGLQREQQRRFVSAEMRQQREEIRRSREERAARIQYRAYGTLV